MNKFLEHMYIKIFQTTAGMVKHVHKYTNLDLFRIHCRYSKLHAEKVPITKEQIRQTFVHKNLDFFRPLQVWQNMSKIHKFRPFL